MFDISNNKKSRSFEQNNDEAPCQDKCLNCEGKEFEAEYEKLLKQNIGLAELSFKGRRICVYSYDLRMNLESGDEVVLEVENGLDNATIRLIGKDALCRLKNIYKTYNPGRKILRKASEEDFDQIGKNALDEQTSGEMTRNLVRNLGLEMKVTDAEWQFDRQRLTIFFTAPQRVDFRELVRELARSFRTRIELRQISAREEARRLGGVGGCGKDVCCQSFLPDFNRVTLDHARVQQLSNNAAKLSGYCGRLKCCLLFEHQNYSEELAEYPKIHSKVKMNGQEFRITKIDIFKSLVFLQADGIYLNMPKDEINQLVAEGKVRAPEPRELAYEIQAFGDNMLLED